MVTCSKCLEVKDAAEFYKGQVCKSCVKARVQAWRVANRAKHRAQAARYREKHRDERNAKNLAYYHEQMREAPGAVRARRRAAARTPKGALYNRLAAHRRRGVGYDAPARDYAALMLKDPCVYCGGIAAEVDHIDPVSRGGTGDWMNLAPACRSCNARKCDQSLLPFLLTLKGAA